VSRTGGSPGSPRGDPGDRERVDRVGLPATDLRPPFPGGHQRRNLHDRHLAARRPVQGQVHRDRTAEFARSLDPDLGHLVGVQELDELEESRLGVRQLPTSEPAADAVDHRDREGVLVSVDACKQGSASPELAAMPAT